MTDFDLKDEENSWRALRHYILKELENFRTEISKNSQDITSIKIEIAVNRFKMGIWGSVGAAIPTIAAVLLFYFTNFFSKG